MTDDSMPEDDPIDSSEPIDADFEPAPEETGRSRGGPSGGPGWLGALVLSLFAAGLGVRQHAGRVWQLIRRHRRLLAFGDVVTGA